ncbi:MAG: hypothetical protein IMW85_00930 [Thermicanus sp.]|nr:hypothetical protein [Thermicanus sp.]
MSIISSEMVKTRKDHYCFGCARKIPKGNKMQRVKSVDMGSISTIYWCEVCQEYWNKHVDYEDEIGYGDLRFNDTEGWDEVKKSIEGEDRE